ncbi:MAG: hypothetical protein ACD_58C00092G0010 [uncultured bacterium]|nr:MAG: hypothetical protein ACD_58C00092G0010 [uncultured bacterium]
MEIPFGEFEPVIADGINTAKSIDQRKPSSKKPEGIDEMVAKRVGRITSEQAGSVNSMPVENVTNSSNLVDPSIASPLKIIQEGDAIKRAVTNEGGENLGENNVEPPKNG